MIEMTTEKVMKKMTRDVKLQSLNKYFSHYR